MARRPTYRRAISDFKRGVLARWPADKPPADQVARRVRYVGNGEHKTYPSKSGQWTFVTRSDKSKCDLYDKASGWSMIVEVLRQAIRAPGVHKEFCGDFPARVWIRINGTLHEARLSNPETGEYHGFPLEYAEQYPRDPDDLLRSIPDVAIPQH